MKNNNRFKLDTWGWITLITIAFYALFLLYPMAHLAKMAFFDSETNSFTMGNFIKFFSKSYYSSTLLNSFKVSIAAAVTSLIVGTPLAYLFTIYKIKGKKTLQILIIISSMSAPFVGAYSWILLLGRNGVITNFLKTLFHFTPPDIYGFGGILLVFTTQLFPLIFLYVQGALHKVDNSLLEASQNMGCSGAKRFFKIVLPLITPTILAGALLVFMRALADFGTPMLIGEGFRTFPVILYNEFVGEVSQNKGFASAIAIIAILITMFIFLVQKHVSNRKSFSMNSLHPIEEKDIKGLRSVAVHAFCYIIVGISILPQVYVIYTSFQNTRGLIFVKGYSLNSYTRMVSKLGNSIANTIIIPLTALFFVVLLAVLIAYITVRRRNAMTGLVDVLSMIPYIVPGIVIGIAMLTSFNKKPLLISGGMLIMVIALIIRRLPYTVRSSVAVLHLIPMSIEEAAISLGSSKLKAFFAITVPMMASGIISGAILSWVNMISELSTAIILYTVRTQTLTVAIYSQIIRGNYGVAAALATVLTVLTVISLLILNRVSKGKFTGM
ncbi:MAG: iron ABC transporter permease [Bacillota bacterium]|nr:iron ABC transporter permease [Bacillota bacterium]